ncbi:MAG: CRP-like cAMP-binding protein [Patiriisocius sp.]|jgi:CRP-like cAMP-binding protein
MELNNTSLKDYIITCINDTSLIHLVPAILDSFTYLQLSKNDLFVKKGLVCKYFCYVESGILQHSLLISEEEKTTYLALKNSCTAALHSFKNKTPSRKNIRAISDCSLWVIDINGFETLLKNNLAFHKFYFNLIENQIFRIDNYRIDLITLTPEERYQKLLQNEPILLQKVPLHFLASFLGISVRHMSRIRKNIK